MSIINTADITRIQRCLDESGDPLYYILNSTERFGAHETALVNSLNMDEAVLAGIVVEDIIDDYTVLRSTGIHKYPTIEDQLDMIFHAGLGGDAFQAAIQAVKDAYPKVP